MNQELIQAILGYMKIGLYVAVVLVSLTLLTLGLLWLYKLTRLLKRKQVLLTIEPPARSDLGADATKQLFVAMHSLTMPLNPLDKFIHYIEPTVFEILASKETGITYRIRITEDKIQAIRQHVVAYVPDAKTDIQNYVSPTDKRRVLSFRQRAHYALPLQSQELLENHDPMGYITTAMTKLEPGEQITYQLVIKPVRPHEASSLQAKILNNEDLLPKLTHQRGKQSHVAANILNKALFAVADGVTGVYHGHSKAEYQASQKDLQYEKQVAKRIKPVRTLSYFEHELVESVHQKLSQQLFAADIRVALDVANTQEYRKRRKSLEAGFGLFSVPKYQGLKTDYPIKWLNSYRNFLFDNGLTSPFKRSNILSASELASLYHFPHSVSAKTENVVKSLSRTLPAPVSLKNGIKPDIVFGENRHHGSITPIGLTETERERHVYIIGGTGNGKTTMLQYAIIQDIGNNKGVAVLDPHGDLSETILKHIPEHRIKDVIYLNPDDLSHPIGINLLELTPGLEGDDLLREKDLITESCISVLRKIFSDDDSGGHRIEYVLRNTIQTALTIEGSTLFTIFHLLNDNKYRRNVIKTLQDEDLKNFWNNELGKAGEFQKVKMVAGITAKVGRFLFSASAKRILEQPKSSIDFDDILSSGKILICNFSKGLLGEDTSTLFGTTVLAKLQVASLRRARLQQTERRPYYLYVDEFQNFATMSFVQMLSEARKYKMFLTMAEQSTSQQDQQRLVDIILANVGTVICFRSGSPADERYVLPLFSPYIQQGEIANLPAYNFYVRIAAIHAQEPMSGNTVLLQSAGSVEVRDKVAKMSREIYAPKREINSSEPVVEVVVQKVTKKRTRKITQAVHTKKQGDMQASI